MKAYESPRIRIIDCEMTSRLQSTGTPIPLDCDLGQNCNGIALVSSCIVSANELTVEFLLVGSTSTDTSVCTINYDGVDYSSCTMNGPVVCAEGVYWQAFCSGVPCTTTNPVTIECDGAEQQGACEPVDLPPEG